MPGSSAASGWVALTSRLRSMEPTTVPILAAWEISRNGIGTRSSPSAATSSGLRPRWTGQWGADGSQLYRQPRMRRMRGSAFRTRRMMVVLPVPLSPSA